jgi:vacuolar-type H+-ATPase subunit I/STV1
MNTTKLIIAIIIGWLLGIGLAMLFAPPKIIEKPIEVVIKEPSNEWRKQDAYLDSLQTADSLRIAYLNKRITQRENTINQLKTIIINDTTKISKEAKKIINSKDSTINELAEEAEIYSHSLHSANKQIASRDSVINVRDSTVHLCKTIITNQADIIKKKDEKDKRKTFVNNIKDGLLLIESTAIAILILVK